MTITNGKYYIPVEAIKDTSMEHLCFTDGQLLMKYNPHVMEQKLQNVYITRWIILSEDSLYLTTLLSKLFANFWVLLQKIQQYNLLSSLCEYCCNRMRWAHNNFMYLLTEAEWRICASVI